MMAERQGKGGMAMHRRRRMAVALAAGCVLVLGAAMIVGSSAGAAAKPKPSPQPTPTGWHDPLCEVDGSPWTASPLCTPPAEVPQPPPTADTCLGAVFCDATYEDMEAAGFDTSLMRANDAARLATIPMPASLGTGEVSAASVYYLAWLDFYLYAAPTNCDGTKRDHNHCGWLYHKYQQIVDGVPKPGVYTTSFPARSGNNDPADMWVVDTGPQPSSWGSSSPSITSGRWRWGWMNGSFTGYEADSTDTYYPGKWRLDPWTVWRYSGRSGTQRGAFEIHGGTGRHDFSQSGTHGCIRLPSDSITGLKGKWDNYTDNKRDPYVELVDYYY
jgi:hypothetical protein